MVVRSTAIAVSILFLAGVSAAQEAKARKPEPVEVRFHDDTSLKLILQEDFLDVTTPYGKLQIPVADVRQVEFGMRLTEEENKQLQQALDDLVQPDPKKHKEAAATLLRMKEKAYAALLRTVRAAEKDAATRVEDLLQKLRETTDEEKLLVPLQDTVQTDEMKVSGKITSTTLKVKTFQFGDQVLKVADIRSIRSGSAAAEEIDPSSVLADPGHLGSIRQPPGSVLHFRVTGAPAGSSGVYGSNIYTIDSNLAAASVHAGVLKSGQTGIVRVTLLGPVATYTPSMQNGINSSGYGMYPGYRISKAGAK
jgi:hypothetical protein